MTGDKLVKELMALIQRAGPVWIEDGIVSVKCNDHTVVDFTMPHVSLYLNEDAY